MKELFCTTKNGFKVYVDREKSHTATHFRDTPTLEKWVKEILENYQFTGENIRFHTDLGTTVGTSNLVPTTPGDEIIYAQRPFREVLSRFVKNRTPEPTSFVTVELRKTSANECDLFTAYFGALTPPSPGKKDETPDSKPFWNSHALVWGTQEVLPGSETPLCPW